MARYEQVSRLYGDLILKGRAGTVVKNPLHQILRDDTDTIRLRREISHRPAARSVCGRSSVRWVMVAAARRSTTTVPISAPGSAVCGSDVMTSPVVARSVPDALSAACTAAFVARVRPADQGSMGRATARLRALGSASSSGRPLRSTRPQASGSTTEVGLGIPRKNGKSTMGAAAALYFPSSPTGSPSPRSTSPRPLALRPGSSSTRHRTISRSAPGSPIGSSSARHRIECLRNGGILRPLSSDAGLQHGLNPSANIIDELHAHRNGELYTALTTGTGAREQPFTLWISTAGVAGEGILDSLYQSMFDGPGELEDRGYLRIYRDRANGVLIYWYGAPRDADIEDPAVWRTVNPSSWIREGDALEKQFAKLKQRGALLEWRMYHLNQFAEHEEAWLPAGAWAGCLDERHPGR